MNYYETAQYRVKQFRDQLAIVILFGSPTVSIYRDYIKVFHSLIPINLSLTMDDP